MLEDVISQQVVSYQLKSNYTTLKQQNWTFQLNFKEKGIGAPDLDICQ